MRQLLPSYAASVDLVTAYAYPPDRPWVRANMVCSLDGAAALHGRSGGLSSPADKLVFGVLRGLCDVVLVGAGTARTEGYRAPLPKPAHAAHRADLGQQPAPVLALVSRGLDLDPGLLVRTGAERVVVLTSAASDERARDRLHDVADVIIAGEESVEIGAALDELAARGLTRVLCEGGPSLLAALAATDRLDELCLTIAPMLVGGPAPRILHGMALPPRTDLGIGHLLEEDGALYGRYVRR